MRCVDSEWIRQTTSNSYAWLISWRPTNGTCTKKLVNNATWAEKSRHQLQVAEMPNGSLSHHETPHLAFGRRNAWERWHENIHEHKTELNYFKISQVRVPKMDISNININIVIVYIYIHTYISTYICIYTYTYICPMHVCVQHAELKCTASRAKITGQKAQWKTLSKYYFCTSYYTNIEYHHWQKYSSNVSALNWTKQMAHTLTQCKNNQPWCSSHSKQTFASPLEFLWAVNIVPHIESMIRTEVKLTAEPWQQFFAKNSVVLNIENEPRLLLDSSSLKRNTMHTVLRVLGYQWINISKLNHKKSNTNKHNKTWNIWKRSNPRQRSAAVAMWQLSLTQLKLLQAQSSTLTEHDHRQLLLLNQQWHGTAYHCFASGQSNVFPEVATKGFLPT